MNESPKFRLHWLGFRLCWRENEVFPEVSARPVAERPGHLLNGRGDDGTLAD